MDVEVLLFAALRDEVGRVFRVEVPETAPGVCDVGSVRRALEAAHPAFAWFGSRALVAVNEEYARDGDPVRPGDTVALLPPVAGG